jgi:voltage-gated potassium channel
MPADGERPIRSWLARRSMPRVLITLVAILVIYYFLPLDLSTRSLWVGLALTLVGVVVMAWTITTQVRLQMSDHPGTEPASLAVVVMLAIGLFALSYYALQENAPDEFAGLDTRTDSLYFTVTTLTTVGYGDVHAEGQVARSLVTIQQVFDVVFIAALLATYTGPLRTPGPWPGSRRPPRTPPKERPE